MTTSCCRPSLGERTTRRHVQRLAALMMTATALVLLVAPTVAWSQGWQPSTQTVRPSEPAQRPALPDPKPAEPKVDRPPPKPRQQAAPAPTQPMAPAARAPVAPPVPNWPTPGGPTANVQAGSGKGRIALVALITEDGQRIEQGMVWNVFQEIVTVEGRQARHVTTVKTANPVLDLPAGDYVITASFGRAAATRRFKITTDVAVSEQIVLNAGGLRLQTTLANGEPLPAGASSIDIYSDERDQAGHRILVAGGIKSGIIVRLNSGIYHVVSTFGDANAQVRADLSVEAGKLTEATIAHQAARVTLKLVARAGGEALADTQWSVATPQGIVVKESVGALPTHLLAPGTYSAIARSSGRVFRRDFAVKSGDAVQVEVVAQ